MSIPEIRGHWVLREGINILPEGEWEGHTQQAIPWCATHDEGAIADGFVVCRVGVVLGASIQTFCVISTGGSDHKWWEDK